MLLRTIAPFLALTVGSGVFQVILYGQEQTCSVTFKVLDAEGHDRPYKVASIAPAVGRGGKDLAASFHGLVSTGLKCDIYNVLLEPLDKSWRGPIPVLAYQDAPIRRKIFTPPSKHELVVLKAPRRLRFFEPDRQTGIRVQLSNLPRSASGYWAELHDITQNGEPTAAAFVDASGRIDFETRSFGVYLLSLHTADRIVAVVPIQLPEPPGPANVVNIDLKGRMLNPDNYARPSDAQR